MATPTPVPTHVPTAPRTGPTSVPTASAANAPSKPESKPEAPKTDATPTAPATAPELAPYVLKPDTELLKVTAPRNQRSAEQIAMDTTVKAFHAKWVAANRPSQWNVMASAGVVATFFSDLNKGSNLRRIINRAAGLHEVRIRWGTSFVLTPEFVAKQRAAGVAIPDTAIGKEAISFAVMDKRPDNLTPAQRKAALAKAQATRKASKTS